MSDRMVATVLCTWPWQGGEDDTPSDQFSVWWFGRMGWLPAPQDCPLGTQLLSGQGQSQLFLGPAPHLTGTALWDPWFVQEAERGLCR